MRKKNAALQLPRISEGSERSLSAASSEVRSLVIDLADGGKASSIDPERNLAAESEVSIEV